MEKMERIAATADRLKEALKDAGKRPIDLARETGLSHSTVSRYLSGAVEPRQEATHKIAKVLGVSEMWLWGYSVQKARTAEAKKNDQLASLVVKMRRDPDFFGVVSKLAELPAEQYASVKSIILSLGNK